jgi:hypothetical protein
MTIDPVVKPRRLKYLRIVLSARIEETSEADDVDAVESSEIIVRSLFLPLSLSFAHSLRRETF